jgi:C-terminal processing protease CtpA/Prc
VIRFALKIFDDDNAFLDEPDITTPIDDYIGITFHSPGNIIIYVYPNSPAEKAGVHVGDIVVTFYDPPSEPQVRMILLQNGQTKLINVEKIAAPEHAYEPEPTGRRIPTQADWVGYVELPPNSGSPAYPGTYPGRVHQLMKRLDRTPVCGWIIDLRRNDWGDIWSYLASLGSILGEGDVGGFLYPDGTHELWSYRDGKVFWADNERYESLVQGGIYIPKQKTPPVALLISDQTKAASELVLVAFKGREKVRTFGEPTHGLPVLIMQTGLSDGAGLFVSGAFGTDRNGNIYKSSIIPAEIIKTDWLKFGTDQDPVILSAVDWLNTQPECGN